MEYFLMRKDDVVTLCDFSDDGNMLSFSRHFRNPEIAPFEYRASDNYLHKWWEGRQIPIRQGRVEKMLRDRGLTAPGEYLLRNLGLSLTDYYWIKPVGSSLRWSDVNLFENDFKENLMTAISNNNGKSFSCTPNSSLRGELEKSWVIRNGRRVLIKGNHGSSSSESINEVIASEMHKKQKYDNYTKYKLIRIKGKEYDYGCFSEAFTSGGLELVSAYALLTSEPRKENMSPYEQLIDIAVRNGINGDQFRKDLEYQIVSDYILSNVDRHMDNIGILRDAESLKFIRMAPIFDTGRAFGGRGVTPYTDEEIDAIEINSFEDTEAKMLTHVTDRKLFDLNKALHTERIGELYNKDSKMKQGRIKNIMRLYEKKLERVDKWQKKGR